MAWRNEQGMVAIAQVELKQGTKGLYALAIEMGLMNITADFVPVESSHERVVAGLLVALGGAFIKRLLFDAGA